MKLRVQIGGYLLALGISAGLALPCAAQKPRNNDRPPRQQQKQEQRQERRQDRPASTPKPRGERTYTPGPPPRNPETNKPRAGSANSLAGSNRPPNATVRPRELSPEERQRLQQNQRRFNQLTPQQKDDMRRRAEVWQRMTPGQQTHVKSDVLPKWKQLPPDRQRAIQHRLAVLQNMPESARNQHLHDPNFTRGMSEEDKATLRDLSHLHVGGAPEPPGE
ncbi:MAG TPA: DUF3106 domain-containing protein [Candidatus Acidoferrum sp.]|nr:DUF3106 domain-containing protein [Candidatus Acidoferrum sp.]